MGVALHVVDARQGAPSEIALTPLIVFQNHRGRSIYQGRTNTPDRIRNFIRTSRFVPQGAEPNRRLEIPVWPMGRQRIWAPLKVSSVSGTPPENYDDQTFRAEALEAISRGFTKFNMRSAVALGRADRGFYMDFYPWRGKDGTLFLSLALYSQFHCKEPIFERKKPPLIGPWKERTRLFAEAAALMEAAVTEQIRRPETGDAFDPLDGTTLDTGWEQVGFPLPPAPPRQTLAASADAHLVRDWILSTPEPQDPPLIQFRFQAPLDNYAGEVKAAQGHLALPAGLELENTAGAIEIDTRSAITMGDPILDEAIQGVALLNARQFPRAAFDIESISSDGRPIAYGQLSPAAVRGTFMLKGKSMSLAAPAEFEPVIGADGRPRLIVRTAFGIDLRDFDIEGADGPEPARYTLLFDVNLQFAPKPKP